MKGVIHWVSARHAFEAEIRLFNPLFTKENPDDCEEGQTWEDNLNPESMIVTKGWLEPSLAGAEPGRTFQFERVGYFCPRHRHHARASRLQPHGDAQRFVGEDQQVAIRNVPGKANSPATLYGGRRTVLCGLPRAAHPTPALPAVSAESCATAV